MKTTRFLQLFIMALLSFSWPSRLHAADSKASLLVSKDEASGIVGPVARVLGPKEYQGADDSLGASVSQVVYQSTQEGLGVTVYTFASAQLALSKMTEKFVRSQIHAEDIVITSEPGLGNRAFWCVSPDNAAYMVVDGSQIVGVVVVAGSGEPSRHRQELKRLLEKKIKN